VLAAIGNVPEAIREFDAAIALEPAALWIHQLKTLTLVAVGDDRSALRAVNDALRADPQAPRLDELHRGILHRCLMKLVADGKAHWNGERVSSPMQRVRFPGAMTVADAVVEGRD
jgi:hypothetical protein